MFCEKCGKVLPDNSTVCGYCGEIIDKNIVRNSEQKPIETNDKNNEYPKSEEVLKESVYKFDNENVKLDKKQKNDIIKQTVILPAGVKVINKKTRPLTTMEFFVIELLFLIPVLNIILLLFWSFRKHSNENRKSFSRSILLWILLFILVDFAVILTMLILGYPVEINYWIENIKILILSI